MTTFKKYIFLTGICIILLTTSCQQPGGNTTGSEFMPDMAHSIAYEANYYNYYYNNTWGSKDEYYKFAKPGLPVNGTIPRGYAGAALSGEDAHHMSDNAMVIPANGSVPYYYGDTEEERNRAMAEIIDNPYPITQAGLDEGKELYDIFCGICHGDKGDGLGYLARDGGVYPVAPAILISDEFVAASNGRFYHAIMYGKNLMGGYADKLSYEERWQVIHYIRSLQAKDKKLVYDQFTNTLNDIERPAGEIVIEEVSMAEDIHEDDHHSDDAHH